MENLINSAVERFRSELADIMRRSQASNNVSVVSTSNSFVGNLPNYFLLPPPPPPTTTTAISTQPPVSKAHRLVTAHKVINFQSTVASSMLNSVPSSTCSRGGIYTTVTSSSTPIVTSKPTSVPNCLSGGANSTSMLSSFFPNIEYKLKDSSSYKTWKNLLMDELRVRKLNDIVDSSVPRPNTKFDDEIRRATTRLIIISHLDEQHQRIVENIRDPQEIIQCLDSEKLPISENLREVLFQKICNLKFEPYVKEPSKFIRLLEDLFQRSKDAGMDWGDDFKKSQLIFKIRELRSDICTLNRTRITDYKMIKKWLLDDEATEKELKAISSTAATAGAHFVGPNSESSNNNNLQRNSNGRNQSRNNGRFVRTNSESSNNNNLQHNSNSRNQFRSNNWYSIQRNGGYSNNYGELSRENHNYFGRCRRCNVRGHSMRECRTKGTYCYNCRRITDHIAKDCKDRENNEQASNFRKGNSDKKATTLMAGGSDDSEFSSRYCYPRDCFNTSGKCFSTKSRDVFTRFIIDSGASYHFTNERHILSKLRKLCSPKVVDCAKKGQESALIIKELGELHTYTAAGKAISFTNILFSPEVSENLLSLRQLVEQGAFFRGNSQELEILEGNSNDVIIRAQFQSPFWVTDLRIRNQNETVLLSDADGGGLSLTSPTIRENLGLLWHTRLAHASLGYLEVYKSKMTILKNVTFGKDIMDCQSCALAKVHRNPSKRKRQRSKIVLQRVHSDVMGPITPVSFPGKRKYVITFVDDFSRFAMAFVMCNKDDASDCFKQYLDNMRRMIGKDTKVRYLRTDGGTEYGGEMGKLLKVENIDVEVAEPDTPTHNGVAERINRTLREKTTAMLSDSGVPMALWDHAISQAVYVYNRTPHKSNGFKSPYEVFCGETPDLSFLRRFGSLAIVRKTRDDYKKFDERGIRGVVLNNTRSGYRVLLPSKKIIESKDVEFIENITYKDLQKNKDFGFDFDFNGESDIAWYDNAERDTANEKKTMDETRLEPSIQNDRNDAVPSISVQNNDLDDFELDTVEETIIFDDSSNDVFLSYDRIMAFRVCLLEDEKDPLTYAEVLDRTDREYWIKAMEDEMASLERNDAWDLVAPPKGVNILDSRWVYCRKTNEHDSSTRYKARLVIRGFKDKEVYDIGDVYSPVASKHTVRVILALANKEGWSIVQLDVITAFLNGRLKTAVYMYPPEGMEVEEGLVCLLKCALYGLKISPLTWFRRFDEAAKKMQFNNHPNEPCVYIWRKKEKVVILVLYVDDFLITGNCRDKIFETIRRLKEEFQVKDLGSPKKFLGLEIKRSEEHNQLMLVQTKFIDCLLRRFNAINLPAVQTPAITRNAEKKPLANEKKSPAWNPGTPTPGKSLFREITGSLLHLANGTRPDIMYATNVLCQHQSNPQPDDWERAKRILQYLKGTAEQGLVYKGVVEKEGVLVDAYTDASLGTGDEGCSITGYFVRAYGDPVVWRTRKQSIPAGSSAEAEYFALSMCSKDAVITVDLLERLTKIRHGPALIHSDNQPALAIAKTTGAPKLRHIAKINYHIIRDFVKRNKVILKFVKSEDQPADALTKALASGRFQEHRSFLHNM